MGGRLNFRQREETASAAVGHVWFTDCESLFAPLISPTIKQVGNKRLAIDLSALKQLIWDSRDDCDEEVEGSKGDHPRWIDTSAMLSESPTKTMTSCRLNETLSTSFFFMRPTEDSLAIKAKTGSGEHRRKSRNSCKILTIDIFHVCNADREYSVSTGSEFLRPRHAFLCSARSSQFSFFDDPSKVTPRVTSVTFSLVHMCHLLLCQHCTCVHFRRALGSQAKRCFDISHHIGLHRSAYCALNPHLVSTCCTPLSVSNPLFCF